MPERIRLRRTLGWRKPEGAIVVARPSKWGNPYRVGRCWRVECRRGPAHWHVYDGDRPMQLEPRNSVEAADWAVFFYRSLVKALDFQSDYVGQIRAALAGRDLACWCPLDQPCHGDVLLEIANGVTVQSLGAGR